MNSLWKFFGGFVFVCFSHFCFSCRLPAAGLFMLSVEYVCVHNTYIIYNTHPTSIYIYQLIYSLFSLPWSYVHNGLARRAINSGFIRMDISKRVKNRFIITLRLFRQTHIEQRNKIHFSSGLVYGTYSHRFSLWAYLYFRHVSMFYE